jgi:ABC-type transport system substrate-binding protein
MYTASASFRPDPIMRNLTCQATGWWCNETKDELLANLQSEYDLDKRIAIWEEIQQLFYEDVPRIKIGDSRLLRVQASNLEGISATVGLQPDFSNSWLQS